MYNNNNVYCKRQWFPNVSLDILELPGASAAEGDSLTNGDSLSGPLSESYRMVHIYNGLMLN
jgi:hypothetical protein